MVLSKQALSGTGNSGPSYAVLLQQFIILDSAPDFQIVDCYKISCRNFVAGLKNYPEIDKCKTLSVHCEPLDIN